MYLKLFKGKTNVSKYASLIRMDTMVTAFRDQPLLPTQLVKMSKKMAQFWGRQVKITNYLFYFKPKYYKYVIL